MYICAQLLSPIQLFVPPWTVACQAPLSMEFPRQEFRNGWPFPSPGDLPNTGIRAMPLVSLTRQILDIHILLYLQWITKILLYIQHRELCSIFCSNLSEKKKIWERIDMCICKTESLCCSSETNTTLLTNCTPTWNKKFKKEGNPVICDNMMELRECNAKWNRLVTEEEVVPDLFT